MSESLDLITEPSLKYIILVNRLRLLIEHDLAEIEKYCNENQKINKEANG